MSTAVLAMRPDTGGGPARTRVLPADLDAVGRRVAAGQHDLAAAVDAVAGTLAGSGGMAGDDDPGREFAASYDPAARSVMVAFAAGSASLGGVAVGLVATADNYARADARSTPGAAPSATGGPGVRVLPPTAARAVPSAASGASQGPGLPGRLADFWPGGDPGRLRDVAAAWRRLAAATADIGTGLHASITGLLGINTGPALGLVEQFWGRIWGTAEAPVLNAAVAGCGALGDACDAYAQYVEDVRREVEEIAVEVVAVSAAGLLLTVFTIGASDLVATAGDAVLIARADDAARHLLELAHVVSVPLLHAAPQLDLASGAAPLLVVTRAETEQAVDDVAGRPAGAGSPTDVGGVRSVPDRLSIFYQRLDDLPPARNADEALHQISVTLVEVEDEFSGVAADPDPGLKFDGRMYPPRADFIQRGADGHVRAETKGNIIDLEPDGSIRISDKRSGAVVFSRRGGDSNGRVLPA